MRGRSGATLRGGERKKYRRHLQPPCSRAQHKVGAVVVVLCVHVIVDAAVPPPRTMPRAGGGERAPLVRASTAPKAAVSPAPPPAESQPAAPSGDYAAYPRRWWILFLLSSTSCLQSLVWMTFSPSKVQVQQLYGPSFTTAQIQLLAMWGPLGCLPLILFTAPIVRRLGLRAGVVLAAACVASGAALRSVTVAEPYALWLAHTAQILNAFAAPMVLATPPMLSATWFPPGERATATSIAVMANYGGSGLGFLLALPVATGHDFRLLLWGEASAAAVVLLLCLVDLRWPPTPPKPPSASAAVEVDMSSAVDVLKLLCEPQFTLLGVTYAVSQGIYSAWTGVSCRAARAMWRTVNDTRRLRRCSTRCWARSVSPR